ncbi:MULTISPECIES: hypothetical protein [unclassified Actinoplanes]|uniref:hypothetical protein n=1 Tax=unclassified Actinoplanes TaxID=2626549 RepID=UPI0012BAF900|nr:MULTISPECIES: hypothetical protein [unclassified Actinoplanes]
MAAGEPVLLQVAAGEPVLLQVAAGEPAPPQATTDEPALSQAAADEPALSQAAADEPALSQAAAVELARQKIPADGPAPLKIAADEPVRPGAASEEKVAVNGSRTTKTVDSLLAAERDQGGIFIVLVGRCLMVVKVTLGQASWRRDRRGHRAVIQADKGEYCRRGRSFSASLRGPPEAPCQFFKVREGGPQ